MYIYCTHYAISELVQYMIIHLSYKYEFLLFLLLDNVFYHHVTSHLMEELSIPLVERFCEQNLNYSSVMTCAPSADEIGEESDHKYDHSWRSDVTHYLASLLMNLCIALVINTNKNSSSVSTDNKGHDQNTVTHK